MRLYLIIIGIILSYSFLNAQTISKVEIDKRAYNYYTIKEISEMPDVKIEKINYLISNSFIIPNEMKGKFTKKDINGFEFSSFRKEDERVTIPILVNQEVKSKEYIILLSNQEIEQAYQNIDKKYQN